MTSLSSLLHLDCWINDTSSKHWWLNQGAWGALDPRKIWKFAWRPLHLAATRIPLSLLKMLCFIQKGVGNVTPLRTHTHARMPTHTHTHKLSLRYYSSGRAPSPGHSRYEMWNLPVAMLTCSPGQCGSGEGGSPSRVQWKGELPSHQWKSWDQCKVSWNWSNEQG